MCYFNVFFLIINLVVNHDKNTAITTREIINESKDDSVMLNGLVNLAIDK
ncbi:hypothetical protein SOASR015_24230 [Pectobacterium carotovorum subsp. carotovorum]|nr:hypothetical protein SOASR015_24230 [Pectobacterium carotovorum subsp. carotovorum]